MTTATISPVPTPTLTERDAFLAAIREAGKGGDRTPHLIYADWLEERGETAESLAWRAEGLGKYGANGGTVEQAMGLPAGTLVRAAQSLPGGEFGPESYTRHHHCSGIAFGRFLVAWVEAHRKAVDRAAARLRSEACHDRAARARRRADREVAEAALRGESLRTRIAGAVAAGNLITEAPGGRRLKARAIDTDSAARNARDAAVASGKWRATCRNGGGVNNSYGYPAETECVLAVSDPRGRVVAWFCRRPANKVTSGGAAAGCLPAARPIFDGRYGDDATSAAWAEVKRIHRLIAASGRAYAV